MASKGSPINKQTPVIWGQNEGYLYLQLRDFKSGARKNALMNPIAATLEKDDQLALAAYFTKQKWPNLEQPSAPNDVAAKAADRSRLQSVAAAVTSTISRATAPPRGSPASGRNICKPHMLAFRDGSRGNNPGMSDLMKATADRRHCRPVAISRRASDRRTISATAASRQARPSAPPRASRAAP